ncbi:hypothetical protein ElyMa_000193800, partial [Elysia marginata]
HVRPLHKGDYLLWREKKKNYENSISAASPLPPSENDTSSVKNVKAVDQIEEEADSKEADSKSFTNQNTEPVSCTLSAPEMKESLKTQVQSCLANSVSFVSESGEGSTSTSNISPVSTSTVCDNEQVQTHVGLDNTGDSFNKTETTSQLTSSTDFTYSTENAEDQPSLSLAEIAEFIQNQQPIPGLIKLDVQPTYSSPTPSALTRRPKPWHTSVEESKTSILDTS